MLANILPVLVAVYYENKAIIKYGKSD